MIELALTPDETHIRTVGLPEVDLGSGTHINQAALMLIEARLNRYADDLSAIALSVKVDYEAVRANVPPAWGTFNGIMIETTDWADTAEKIVTRWDVRRRAAHKMWQAAREVWQASHGRACGGAVEETVPARFRPVNQQFYEVNPNNRFSEANPLLGRIGFNKVVPDSVGVIGFISWSTVAELLGPLTPRDEIIGFTLSPNGLTIHKKSR